MKPISFHSKASVVCSVTTAIFIYYCPKKLNVFSQYIAQKQMNIRILSEQISRNEMSINFVLITSWDIT